jgi:hypothetical protein
MSRGAIRANPGPSAVAVAPLWPSKVFPWGDSKRTLAKAYVLASSGESLGADALFPMDRFLKRDLPASRLKEVVISVAPWVS